MGDQQSELHKAIEQCKICLRELLSLWPKPGGTEPGDPRPRLAPYLSRSFDNADLLNCVTGVRTWGRAHVKADETVIEFSDVDGYRQMATFVFEDGKVWLLKALKFQCPVCFGSGKNGTATCTICGGLGWGAS